MNERLVKIMEMITAEGVKASLDLDLWGRLAMIEAYKKNLSLPAKHNAEI